MHNGVLNKSIFQLVKLWKISKKLNLMKKALKNVLLKSIQKSRMIIIKILVYPVEKWYNHLKN